MEYENALNFLLYSYFGVTRNCETDEILFAAANRAYQDAASHVLSVDDTKKAGLRQKGCEKLVAFAKLLPMENYDEEHNKICGELIKLYNGKTNDGCKFTYGIAQKWVNMTMKYLCVFLALINEGSFFNEFHGKIPEMCLHIPLDSFMLEYIAQRNDKKFKNSPQLTIPAKEDGKEVYYSDKALAWSKYTDETYHNLQDAIRKICNDKLPLDWEGPAWIKVAETRKRKSGKKEVEI